MRDGKFLFFLPFFIVGGSFILKGVASLDLEWVWSGAFVIGASFVLEYMDSRDKDEFYK
jgi:hypothetical protein